MGCTIPAPLRMSTNAAAALQCTLDLAAGGLKVSSGVASSRHLAHLHASSSRIQLLPSTAVVPQLRPDAASVMVGLVATAEWAESQPARLPAATASIALRPAEHASGYVAHPAVVDSLLHMGATLAASLQHDTATETRVPTAIGAFSPHKDLCGMPGAWACAEVTGQSRGDGSATSSYRLSADSAPGGLMSLAELQAKALGHPQYQNPSHGMENVGPHLLYKPAWQSSLPTASSHQNSTPLGSHRWLGATTGLRAPGPQRVPAHAATSCLADVAVLQRALAERAGPGLSLVTRGAQQQGSSVCCSSWRISHAVSHAAAWGLVRVAASERPDLAWSAVDCQPVLAAARAGCAVPVADAFGAVLASGTVAVPRILAQRLNDGPLQEQQLSCAAGGRTVITGGLGGSAIRRLKIQFGTLLLRLAHPSTSSCPVAQAHFISRHEASGSLHIGAGVGSLVGAWLAATPGSEVCLIGRTGRPPATSRPFMPLACAAGSAVVSMSRCDVAHCEEAACALRLEGPHPLSSIVHAGMLPWPL